MRSSRFATEVRVLAQHPPLRDPATLDCVGSCGAFPSAAAASETAPLSGWSAATRRRSTPTTTSCDSYITHICFWPPRDNLFCRWGTWLGSGTRQSHRTTAHPSDQPHNSESHLRHPGQHPIPRRHHAIAGGLGDNSTAIVFVRHPRAVATPAQTKCDANASAMFQGAVTSSPSESSTTAPVASSTSSSGGTLKHCKRDETHRLRKNLDCELVRAFASAGDHEVELVQMSHRPNMRGHLRPPTHRRVRLLAMLGGYARHTKRQLARVELRPNQRFTTALY